MADPQPLEVYQYNLKAFYFIRIFKSLYVWELGDKKGMQHLNFRRLSKIYDIHFIFVDNREEMVRKDQQGLMFPTDITCYFSVDVDMVVIFSSFISV